MKRATENAEKNPNKVKGTGKKAALPTGPVKEEGKMTSILGYLTDFFRVGVVGAFPDLPDAPVPVTLSAKQGDYQFNGAMAIAGLLKVFKGLCFMVSWIQL